MAVITPMGMDFDWSPKEKVVKTASTKVEVSKSDKDLLYEAAKKVVKAQFMDLDKPMNSPCDAAPCGGSDGVEGVEGIGDVVPDAAPDLGATPDAAPDATDAAAPSGEGVGDVQKAVKELVDKANKAEEVAIKVQDAVGKVEEAVQEVKDAVGAAGGDVPEEIEIEVEDLGGDDNGEEKGESEKHEKSETPDEEKAEHEDGKKDEEDIVKESKDKKETCASKKVLEMKSAASEDDLAKFAALSPSVKKKIYDYWKNDLKYAPDYCKLLVTDS